MKAKVINCTISYNYGALFLFIAHPYIHLQKFMLLAALIMKVICTSVKLKQLQNELLNCPEVHHIYIHITCIYIYYIFFLSLQIDIYRYIQSIDTYVYIYVVCSKREKSSNTQELKSIYENVRKLTINHCNIIMGLPSQWMDNISLFQAIWQVMVLLLNSQGYQHYQT